VLQLRRPGSSVRCLLRGSEEMEEGSTIGVAVLYRDPGPVHDLEGHWVFVLLLG